jgi:hypothetical protein
VGGGVEDVINDCKHLMVILELDITAVWWVWEPRLLFKN